MPNDLLRRQKALEKTVAKYRGKSFVWDNGCHCVGLLRSHLIAMGHKKLPKMPRIRSALAARKALKATGHRNLESLLDSLLPRIAPAEMLPGDVALMEGDSSFDAITISLGWKLLGWFEGREEAVIIVPASIKAAWRA